MWGNGEKWRSGSETLVVLRHFMLSSQRGPRHIKLCITIADNVLGAAGSAVTNSAFGGLASILAEW